VVVGASGPGAAAPARKRADARRYEATLLDAAAAAFVESGVDVPVREIAARAGVGVGTIYRHFPTRADLIVAVYRHQVEACAEAGPVLAEQLLDAAAAAGEIRPGLDAYELLRGVGNLCVGAGSDPRYNPRHLVELLIAGLRVH
jgi:AcrR family transcriptional regulator